MWFNKSPCNIGNYTWQQHKLFTISLFVLAALLSSVMHFVHINSELWSMVRESVPQTNYSELRPWTLWTCSPSPHPTTVFYQLSRSRLISSSWVDNFLLSGQNVVYTWFRSAIWLVPPEQGAGSRQLFPRMLPGSLPRFWGESLGSRLKALNLTW